MPYINISACILCTHAYDDYFNGCVINACLCMACGTTASANIDIIRYQLRLRYIKIKPNILIYYSSLQRTVHILIVLFVAAIYV